MARPWGWLLVTAVAFCVGSIVVLTLLVPTPPENAVPFRSTVVNPR